MLELNINNKLIASKLFLDVKDVNRISYEYKNFK